MTVVEAIALLFAVLDSVVVVVTDAVFEMLATDVDGSTCARMRTTLEPPDAIDPSESGLLHGEPVDGSHGAGLSTQNVAVAETSSAGSESLSDTFAAVAGPALLTVITYVRKPPALTGSGLSVFVTDRSAF